MSVTRLCIECGGRRAPDCQHDLPEPALSVENILADRPPWRVSDALVRLLNSGNLTRRLLDCQKAERAGQLRLW